MGDASYLQASFLGGEWSRTAQGRIDREDYRTALNRSLNGLPLDAGAWTRRPGSTFASTTRDGAAGRVMTFSFKNATPYTMEFTDGHLRFRAGTVLATANDDKLITSVSSASPAVVTTTTSHGWSTNDQGYFDNLGTANPALHRRMLKLTSTGAATFSIKDALTGSNIDGSALSAFPSGAVFKRILDIATPYVAQAWSSLRSVQAETKAILLQTTVAPYVLEATVLPTASTFATFSLSQANIVDGPYLDPVPGSLATPSALNGNITITLSFQAYDSARSYSIGDYVTSSSVSYRSLTQGNVNHTPASNVGTHWDVVNGGAAVGPSGFVTSDIGRHVRFYSEPAIWLVGTTYSANAVVAYNGTYWIALVGSNTGNIPGADLTKWALFVGEAAAKWTWGKITAVSGAGLISPSLSGVVNIGNMTAGGGNAAAFDTTTSKAAASCAGGSSEIVTPPAWITGTIYAANFLVNYSGTIYKASAPATSAWATSSAPGNGGVVTFNGQYQVVTSQPPAWTGGITWPAGFVVSYGGLWYTSRRAVGSGVGPPPTLATYWELGHRPDGVYTNGLGGQSIATTIYWATGVTPGTNASYWTSHSLAAQLYVGQNFTSPGAQDVSSVTVFPSTDQRFADSSATTVIIQLRAKASAPSSATDGTLLGEVTTPNIAGPVSIPSSDTTTTWNYVWVTIKASASDAGQQPANCYIAQVQFYEPNVANGTVATVQIMGDALLYSHAIRIWRLGVYSQTTGFPTCGTYHRGRLWLSGVIANRIDGSKSNDIFNFAPTTADGTVADDNAIAASFNADDVNPVFWMRSELQGIVCGTQGGEFLVYPPTAGPITPTNIAADRVTKIKCANIEPCKTGLTLTFVQAHQRKLQEYFADVVSGKFTSPNLSLTAGHLSKRVIAEIAYQQELAPIIWARCDDGSLIGVTYKRESLLTSQGPAFAGWHQHTLGSGRVVESICTGPSTEGTLETLAMVTNDALTGIRHVEFLTNIWEEGQTAPEAFYCDNAVRPTTSANVTVSTVDYLRLYGLWHLVGKEVTVCAGGLDLGDYTVAADGTCDVPYEIVPLFTQAFVASFPDGILIVAGYSYESDGQLVRPATAQESGARTGPALGKKRRSNAVAALLVDTQGISFGTRFDKLQPAKLEEPDGTAYEANELWSGVFRNSALDDLYSLDSMLCWRTSRPFPTTVAAIQGFLQTTDS